MTAAEMQRFWIKVDKSGECWIWTAARDRHGYGRFQRGARCLKAHRVAYEFSFGPIPNGLLICHHCDNPGCVNPAHLFAGTARDNRRDAIKKGRQSPNGPRMPGVRNWAAKLTEQAVLEIINLGKQNGMTQGAIAARYGVSGETVSHIITGRNWKHLRAEGCCDD